MEECKACGFDSGLTVVKYWDITLDMKARSGNAIGSSGRGKSGWQYRKERKAYAVAVSKSTPQPEEPSQATAKRRVWVNRLWGKGQRGFDVDNLAWGFKPLYDELKERGWILEDSPKWVERIYQQSKSEDGINYIQIRIEEILEWEMTE